MTKARPLIDFALRLCYRVYGGMRMEQGDASGLWILTPC